MLDNARDRVITEAVIDLGRRLGLRVIAEGVETDGLLDELSALGCDSAQGFAISPALAAPALERLLGLQRHPGGAQARPVRLDEKGHRRVAGRDRGALADAAPIGGCRIGP